MKTILIVLFIALNVSAQKNKKEFLNTGPSLRTIQRMYDSYVNNPFKKPQELQHLEFNFYAYNEMQKLTDDKEKAQRYAFLEINYFRSLCLKGNAKNKKLKKDQSDINCSTYAIRISDYSTKYSPRYTDDQRSKVNPSVKFDFKNNLYAIKNETFSVRTGGRAKPVLKKASVPLDVGNDVPAAPPEIATPAQTNQ